MLDGYGLHQLTWDTCDERFSDVLVASPADAQGRGISLAVRQNGVAANLTGATVYLVWRHKVTGERGTEPFTAINAAGGTFSVYYPAAMQEAEGAVQAQVMVSRGDDSYISSRVFTIRVEPVIVGGEEHEDGFTLFVDAINAYEHATEITTDAADAANAAASAANSAASNASTVASNIEAAAQRGNFDGADGVDGFSPTATVTQTSEGATITITDKNGTTTANIAKGAKGDKGDTGATGPKGDKGDTGATGAQGPKGDTGDTGAAGAQGPKGDKGDTGETGATGRQGPKGDTGDTGPKGDTGAAGADGNDGVSCTHSWNGTVLSVTSASGTSSADLVGPQGPTGATGPAGPAGADGTAFTPQSPLSLVNGVLSVDLSSCAGTSDLHPRLWLIQNVGYVAEGSTQAIDASYSGITDIAVGDWVMHTIQGTLSIVTAMCGPTCVTLKGILELPTLQGIVPTTALDLAVGVSGNAYDGNVRRRVRSGTLLLNRTTGALMQANRDCNALNGGGCFLYGTGIGNVFGGGASYTASSPLSIDASNDISIDLSSYAALAGATFTGAVSGIAPTANAHFATKKYVDDAIAALDDLSGVSFCWQSGPFPLVSSRT